jgi:hypothetical protein
MKTFRRLTFVFLFGPLFMQNKNQIVLNDDVNLQSELGKDYIYYRIKLTPDELKLADSLVDQYVLSNQGKYRRTVKVNNYYSYYRQYAGYTQFTPGRKVFINAFKIKKEGISDTFLRNHLYTVYGGGSLFFTIKVNLQTKTCFDLRVNAPL